MAGTINIRATRNQQVELTGGQKPTNLWSRTVAVPMCVCVRDNRVLEMFLRNKPKEKKNTCSAHGSARHSIGHDWWCLPRKPVTDHILAQP